VSDAGITKALRGETSAIPPLWLMRQAGRYLPEYRAIRSSVSGFMELCLTPKLAAEVTVQPIRRFGFDAAILFSDILVVPYAFGLSVDFVEGEGPRVGGLFDDTGRVNLGRFDLHRLNPVFEAVGRIRQLLGPESPLIGFCGAPFTVASYMVAGRPSPDQAEVRLFAYREPESFGNLVAALVDASVDYLVAQVEAGVQVVQIFDSWAGVLPQDQFLAWCVRPIADLVQKFRARKPDIPVIVFPREAGSKLDLFLDSLPDVAIGLGTGESWAKVTAVVPANRTFQGNLDPLALVAGGEALDRQVDAILSAMRGRPHIFNLGHGILPQTPIENVERLVRRVRRT
jgi:uroporphyrinogen decarboxylase